MKRAFPIIIMAGSLIAATPAQAQIVDLKCQVVSTMEATEYTDAETTSYVWLIHIDGPKSTFTWMNDGIVRNIDGLSISDSTISFCQQSCAKMFGSNGSVSVNGKTVISRVDGSIISGSTYTSKRGTSISSSENGQCQKYLPEQRKF